MKQKIVVEIIAFLFIVLFVYAAVTKLMDYEKFSIQLGQSPMLTSFAPWLAWIVPGVEILISVCLAIPLLRLYAFYSAFSLMVMFTAYIIAILNFSTYIPCSCGGVLERLSWQEHLAFNVAFVFLDATGIILLSPKTERELTVFPDQSC
jgi:uncharacterized membrane protein YphA (DoxX/SURF4 family)